MGKKKGGKKKKMTEEEMAEMEAMNKRYHDLGKPPPHPTATFIGLLWSSDRGRISCKEQRIILTFVWLYLEV